jgi:hypothetical protein
MFRVVWAGAALNELAALWLAADSSGRQAITRATRLIDELLGSEPVDQGESRGGSERIMFVAPLGVTYAVDSQDRVVRVLQVWRFRPRG